MTRLAFAFIVLSAACAQGVPAGDEGAIDATKSPTPGDPDAQVDASSTREPADAAPPGSPDAAPPDAEPPKPVTLSQNKGTAITAAGPFCVNGPGYHAETSYYRIFDLTAEKVAGAFDVSSVEFGVFSSTGASGGTQPAEVRLYTLSGTTPTTTKLTRIGIASVSLKDGGARLEQVAVTGMAPAGARLGVEVFLRDARFIGDKLKFGANDLGETAPAYWRVPPGCGSGDLESLAQAAPIILTVTGTPR